MRRDFVSSRWARAPLVVGGFAEFQHPALLATRPESLLFIAIWAGIVWLMLRRRGAERAVRGGASASDLGPEPASRPILDRSGSAFAAGATAGDGAAD